MANVTIDGHGSFTVNAEKIQELLQWLTTNSVRVESTEKTFEGKTLLNEGETQPSRKIDPTKTWDFGTPWI